MYMYTLYEPRPEKICHRGLRPGLTQDGLYSHINEPLVKLRLGDLICAFDFTFAR